MLQLRLRSSMTGHESPPELKVDEHRKPIFARSCRSAQPGYPTAPREVHLPLLPHGPSGVHRHLPRRTRLRRSAGPEENRSVPLTFLRCGTPTFYSSGRQLSSKILADQQAIFLLHFGWNPSAICENSRRKCAWALTCVGTAVGRDFLSDLP